MQSGFFFAWYRYSWKKPGRWGRNPGFPKLRLTSGLLG
jgi:hypothetical protein